MAARTAGDVKFSDAISCSVVDWRSISAPSSAATSGSSTSHWSKGDDARPAPSRALLISVLSVLSLVSGPTQRASSTAISSTRCSWRPPMGSVDKKVSMASLATSFPTIRPPRHTTLA